ncbi:unnamed protein product, partial [Rangifer tarandus platyrhynchus]
RVQEGVKPLRGKRVGSAQSARRIQPGGGSGRAGGPADLSRSPFLPTPPPALPPPLAARPSVSGRRWAAGGSRGWAGGAGGGVGGGPPPGRRPGAAGRISTAAVRRDRLRDGWEGRRGRWLGGAPSSFTAAAGPPPRVLQPPGSSARRIPGPREPDLSPRSPPSRRSPPRGRSREGAFPAGARRCSTPPRPRPAARGVRGGRAAPPTARPLSHPGPPPTGWVGAGRTVPSAPRAGRAVGPGGCLSVTPVGEASARGQRRCRPPTRPVLKHGPRSLTRARVRGSHESRRGAM